MKVFLFLFIMIPFISFGQVNNDDILLMLLSDNAQAECLFTRLVTEHKFTNFYAESTAEKINYISMNKEELCLNKSCQLITSPIYFFRSEDNSEFYFTFRLEDNTLCIIVVIDSKINSIEILPTKTRTYIIYENRNIH